MTPTFHTLPLQMPWQPQPSRQAYAPPVLIQGSYHTTFPGTENPISEGGLWIEGLTNGLDWSDIRTTTNKAFGTQAGSPVPPYNDSIAVLRGSFGPDQESRAVVFNNLGAGGDFFAEVELLFRFAISTHVAQGYEVLFGLNPATGKHYVEIVKWLGAVNSFFSLTSGSSVIAALVTGDVVSATIIGNTLTAYVNGSVVATITDSVGLSGTAPYTTGNPGIGHWLHNVTQSGDPTTYGFSDFRTQPLLSIDDPENRGRPGGLRGLNQMHQLLVQ